jgi:hypothetical protein
MASNESLIKQIDKLKSPLATSSLSQTNQPLFQVITQLIDVLRGAIGNIEESIGGGGGGGGGLANQQYVTWINNLAQLPNSRVAVAGVGIDLDLATAGQIIIAISSIITDATFLTATDESATFPNSRQLLAGTGITFDDTVPNERTINSSGSGSGSQWSVLTNGDADNPELIFADGDVIMIETP